ncbi:M14 metallopeptidase family protein [Pedobacter sp. L105]|uniref:M14 metallopeptidase family protein n=1 Tax=Pedobacter sp. L105 TaxID=1641871 RepID=UPI00131C4A28|nr:M14 family zinc carboxypeptidase [Pedobacter sp. L105]
MKKTLLSLFFLFFCLGVANAQIKSPEAFLGYPLGSRFTPHTQIIAYFKYLAAENQQIRLIDYGKTYEHRELMVAVISSKENMDRLDEIRKNNLALSRAGDPIGNDKQPAILWLSYNVHGNEASSSETSMKVLYTLASGTVAQTSDWLKNTVVVIDPCLNPDGRERFVNYFTSVSGAQPNANPDAREHSEPWPRGRVNHYYFDLNRDWAWQSQIETRQRLALYHQWMPEVHVDFHEQGYNNPYYFAPAAEPVHQDITPFQREFQVIAGKNNAKYFDENGWQYFTKERFDLLYPSYGDTYPLYNGAIGMTYEQGGIGAGLAVVTASGDTLTLANRINHHYTTSMATLETVSNYSAKLVTEFKQYFKQAMTSSPGQYKTYVVKADNLSRLKKMADLLTANHIDYAFGGEKTLSGLSFQSKKTVSFKLGRNDLVINMKQPAAVLADVLFEPQTKVTDSNTYDITAWALPYAYGLNAYACKESVSGAFSKIEEENGNPVTALKPYAWILPWNGLEDARVLIALQRANVKVRMAEQGFTTGGKVYVEGSLLVYRLENEGINKDITAKIAVVSKEFNTTFTSISTGYVEKGKDFGSTVYPVIPAPKVTLVSGDHVSAQAVGEVWHFFEQELHYPLNIIPERNLGYLDLSTTTVLILPDGEYMRNNIEKLEDWINRGGKVILMEDAISSVIGIKPFDIKKKEFSLPTDSGNVSRMYREKDHDNLADAIPGAIYKVSLDKSHPLTLALGDFYYTLKTDDKIYEPLKAGWNVGMLKSNAYVAGVVGKNIQKKLSSGLIFGVQPAQRGNIIYFSGDVLFRSFWESGKQLFTNALFLIN